MRLNLLLFAFVGLLGILNVNGQATVDDKVDSVLNLMTLSEKVGQMTQVERNELDDINDLATYGIGSILSGGGSAPSPNSVTGWANMYDNFQSIAMQSNLGIPIIYGVDAVHGHNNVFGAVIFPHNIGMGCTWNPQLARRANEIVAKEVAATGVDWTFSPCIAVPQNEKWGRTYEGFGETAEISKIMAEESVMGLQGDVLSLDTTILACAKHFVGDGGTDGGIDQGNTVVSEQVLRDVHMAGYIDAIESGVGSIMASYSSWNGEKLHGHEYLLTDVLKNELGFEGFVISDWKGVDQLNGNYREAIKQSINAGIDMVMVPDRYQEFIGHLIDLVQNNEVSENRIDDAVRRILKQKFLLNLFAEPYTNPSLAASFGSQEHRDVAKQAVRESMVLLNAKNDVLPLQKNGQTIMVAGTLAADLGAQCGGWTISWQGGNGNITEGTDILTGIQNLAQTSQVIYSPSGNYNDPVDVAVVVVGEKTPYAEGGGYRADLNIDNDDVSLIKMLKENGIPTIALLVSGRPMIISEGLPYTDATFAVWYPGTEGDGIAEVLFGDFDPIGQLTHSWPKNMGQVPINFGDANYDPLFEYKHGLQDFPQALTSDSLLPYAAVTNNDGSTIALALTDQVTILNYESSDFEIRSNNSVLPGIINTISLAGFDESILLIELNSQIQESANITVSYSGDGIYSASLLLNTFNNYYVHNISGSSGGIHIVPGRIEAEDYIVMSGVQTEPCTDIGGGLNVGWIDIGDWMKYNIEVTQTGQYNLISRISGYKEGTLLLTFNDTIQVQVDYTSTNGWQNWEDFSAEIYLEQGIYIMNVIAQSDSFNINYFDILEFGDFISIPGVVEAENYVDMFGIQTEPCLDTGGGLNVGWIDPGDWMMYNVEVTQTGQFELTSRISGFDPGTLLLTFNDTIQVEVDYTSTNGWQNWEDFSTEVFLEQGFYDMTALAQSAGFNINYFDFELTGGIDLDLLVYLEGPFNGTDMNTHLVGQPETVESFPLSQPFNSPPWNYAGSESVSSLPNTDIVDWVLIQLRDAPNTGSATPLTTIATQAAFLLNNGAVVGLDGSSVLQFPTASFSNNLYAVVYHRNHLGIISANGLTETGGIYTYDFSTSITKVHNGSDGYKQISIGVYGMAGGDANADGEIDTVDKTLWTNDAGTKDYKSTDLNLDGQVNNPDKNDIWGVNGLYSTQVPE